MSEGDAQNAEKVASDCGPYVCVVPGCENTAMLCRRVCREHNPRPFTSGEGDR